MTLRCNMCGSEQYGTMVIVKDESFCWDCVESTMEYESEKSREVREYWQMVEATRGNWKLRSHNSLSGR